MNGFVQKYYPLINQKLINNELYHLVSVLEQIKHHESSEELIAFFFSLENNKRIREGNFPISFSKDLKDDEDFKLVFLMFYASIIYHLALLMKSKGMEPPRYILFSGTGSKVVNIADPGQGLRNLTEFTNLIFKDVLGMPSVSLELKQYDEPKEITCKGSLLCDQFINTDNIKTVVTGMDVAPGKEIAVRYHQLQNREVLQSVTASVGKFIDKFFEWNDAYHYPQKFGVNPSGLGAQKLLLKEDMMQYLMAGVKEKLEEEKDNLDLVLDETLFFYSLRGLLHRMARHITNMNRLSEREVL
ncbi:MAG: hypothetical protein EOP49_18660 [Sphingobacteriales bacterium]|nr:MAG: hypothetical protein EOP49_18660 [Sphingobacteriales bacterium]